MLIAGPSNQQACIFEETQTPYSNVWKCVSVQICLVYVQRASQGILFDLRQQTWLPIYQPRWKLCTHDNLQAVPQL